MVVILVALTFVAVITAQWLLERRRRAALLLEGDVLHETVRAEEPRWVGGFELPRGLHYHPSHTWVHRVSDQVAYVGIDDFARRLVGAPAQLRLPTVGSSVTQGEPAIGATHDGHDVQLLSPVSGKVVAVNPRLKADPESVHDVYGRGWLYKVKSPRLFTDLTNLLRRSLAERWMEDTRSQLDLRLMLASGSVIQDGGILLDDLRTSLPSDEWKELVDEFLRLEPVSATH